MKNNRNNREIKIPVLNNEYYVIVCWGDKPFVKRVLRKYEHKFTEEDFDWSKYSGRFFSDPCRYGVIALPRKPKTADEFGTLAHEAVHAVKDIFDHIEEKSIDEVFAHSVGAIVREALN